jgi:hypothetical protein
LLVFYTKKLPFPSKKALPKPGLLRISSGLLSCSVKKTQQAGKTA